MLQKNDEISTLISILSIQFPTNYPNKENLDDLDSIIPGISFPKYTHSEINNIISNSENLTEFKDILKGNFFYFPFTPTVLHIISNCDDDTEELVDFCACIVMCSYLSWKVFVEYTQNFEHLPFLLDAIPYVSKSNHSDIISQIYYNLIHYYLSSCQNFNFNTLYKSLSMLLERKALNVLSKVQSLFLPILSNIIPENFVGENDDLDMFVKFLGQLTDTSCDIIENDEAKLIVEYLIEYIKNIETNSLHLFANLCSKIPKDLAIQITSEFPKAITNMTVNNISNLKIHETLLKKTQIKFPKVDINKANLESQTFTIIDSTFQQNFQVKPTLSFERKYPNGFFFPTSIRDKLMHLARTVQFHEECTDIILNFLEEAINNTNGKFDSVDNKSTLFYVLVTIISNLQLNNQQSEKYWNSIFSSDIFNQNFSSYDCDDPDEIVNQIRAESLDAMIKSGYLGFESALLYLKDDPVFFSEVFHRIYPNLNKFIGTSFLSQSVINNICTKVIQFQQMNIFETNDESLVIIESTRSCLFQFIASALSIQNVADFWFSSQFFNTTFFSFILENKVRQHILNQYSLYISNFFHLSSNNSIFIQNLKNMVNSLIKNGLRDEHFVLILIDIITMTTSILSNKIHISEIFYDMIDVFVDSIKTIITFPNLELNDSNQSAFSDALHLYFIHFLKMLSYINLTNEHFILLDESIKKMKKHKYKKEIELGLFQLASGLQNPSEVFPLKHPEIIIVLIQNCENNDELLCLLNNIIYPLFKASIYNCVQAFKAKVDELLMDKIMEVRFEHLAKYEITNSILKILLSIHLICGSVRTISRINEILMPIDQKQISAFTPFFIDFLTKIFQNYNKTPSAYMPLSSKLEVHNINSSLFKKPFELAFWCNIEPYNLSSNTTQLCFISDSKGKGLNISFTNNSLILRSIQKHESSIEFDASFQYGKWHIVSLKFSFAEEADDTFINSFDEMPNEENDDKSERFSSITRSFSSPENFSSDSNFHFNRETSVRNFNKIIVCANIDGKDTEYKHFPFRDFKDQSLLMTLGFSDENAPMGYISNCSIYPFYHERLSLNSYDNFNSNNSFDSGNSFSSSCSQNSYHFWVNNQMSSPDEPLYSFNFQLQNRKPIPKSHNESNMILIDTSSIEIPQALSTVFFERVKSHSLMMLFAEVDFITIEDVKVPGMLDMTIKLFSEILQCGRQSQSAFHEFHCVDAISHLLSVCDATNLSYSIYLQLYSIMYSLLISELQINFLEKFILNLEIWGKADLEILHLVTEHWNKVVFFEFQQELKVVTSITFLLNVLKSYFNDDITSNNISNLILKFTKTSFTVYDFMLMIGFCITSTDIKLTNLYLAILRKTLHQLNEFDKLISKSAQYIALLHNLLGFNNEDILVSLVEIIIVCHRKNLINSLSLTRHLNIILGQITVKLSTLSGLRRLIMICNSDCPELFPLCSLIALNCGNDAVNELAKTAIPSSFFGSSPECLMWIVIMLCHANIESSYNFYNFLFKNMSNKVQEISSLMQIFGIVSNQSPDQQLMPFLSLSFSFITDHPENYDTNFVHQLLKIAYESLLYRSKGSIAMWLYKIVNNSPFPIKNRSINETPNTKIFSKTQFLYNLIEKLSRIPLSFKLCPRIDENGVWLDTSLAFQCLNIFEIFFSPDLLNYDIILSAFLLKVKPNTGRAHLLKINSMYPLSHKISPNMIDFILSCGEKYNVDLSFISSKTPLSNHVKLNAFLALEEFSHSKKLIGKRIMDAASNLVEKREDDKKIEREFTSLINHGVVETCVISIEQIEIRQNKKAYMSLETWKQFWYEMTRFGGLWYGAKKSVSIKKHWKRSSRISSPNGCILKMNLNDENYKDHADASLARDIKDDQINIKTEKRNINTKKVYGIIFKTLRPAFKKRENSLINSILSYLNNDIKSELGIGNIENAKNSSSIIQRRAIRIKPQKSLECEFEMNNRSFIINSKMIDFTEIKEILMKRRFQRQSAIEIFLNNGKSYFIDIFNTEHSSIEKYILPFLPQTDLQSTMEKWVRSEISNFEYLMRLNNFSGRTFNDLSQYPVMPWVIADYTSTTLDLNSIETFRDLTKPMGALNPDRLTKLQEISNTIANLSKASLLDRIPAYLYSYGFLTKKTVLSYLVRMEPFTTIHIQNNNNAFESTSEIFKSIAETYENATNNMSDFRELIPEFFASPEFLINSENFDLGKTGKKNGNVILPKWAKSAIQFVYLNRKALESKYVSNNLHHWIDLIWGYKQNGVDAYKSNNTFHPFMYSNVWNEYFNSNLIEELATNYQLTKDQQTKRIKQIEDILSDNGQIPLQLFTNPHPRKGTLLAKRTSTSSINGSKNIIITSPTAFKLSNDTQLVLSSFFMGKPRGFAVTVNGKLLSIHIRGNTASVVSTDNIDMSYFGTFSTTGIGISGFGDTLTNKSFVCTVGIGTSFMLYKPQEKIALRSGKVKYLISHAAIDDAFIATAGIQFTSFWKTNDLKNPVFTVVTYCEKISCVNLSASFDLIVSGTFDGFLQFISIKKQKSLRVIDLKNVIPLVIKITPSWGFVLVYGLTKKSKKRVLSLLTSNGLRIKQIEIDEALTGLTVYSTTSGFDYAIIATESGKLYHFEVFFLNIGESFYQSEFPIKSISYIKEDGCIFCTGNNNIIVSIPLSSQPT